MPPVQLLIKPSSGNCNLRCRYCFYYDEMGRRETASYGFMSLETLENLVHKSMDYAEGSCDFAFQGGEPTLSGLRFFEQLLALEKKYNTKGLTVHNSIQTNGYGLGEEWADFFAANHFLVGVSLDGIRPTHDAYRRTPKGEDSFWEVKKTINLFQKKQVDFNILTVVNRRTAQRIRKIYELYQKEGWHYLQFIPCLDPLGEQAGNREYSLTPEAYGEFLVTLFDLWYADLCQGRQPYIRMFENYIGILMGIQPEACDQRGRCSIQHVVEADGSVYPCDFYVMDAYRMGSFNEDDVEELRRRGESLGFVQASLRGKEACEACPYGFICRGGCRRNRQVEADGALGDNYFCSSYKRFFEAALPRMREIAAALRTSPAAPLPL